MSVLTNFFDYHDVYIETGLGHGQTLAKAIAHGFLELHVIEIDQKLIDMANEKFSGFPGVPLTIHHGSSPDVLPEIIDPKRQTLFWLDAHYSAGLYTSDSERDRDQLDPRHGECPLLAELKVIAFTPWTLDPIILIDDAVCFTAKDYKAYYTSWDRSQHPMLDQIKAAILLFSLGNFSVEIRDDGTGEYLVCQRRIQ